jgi:acetate---CoA ligase (ADP-forming)
VLAYPVHREADVVLRDGSTVHVRPIRPEERDAFVEFLRELSPDSRFFRFFSGSVDLDKAADWAVDVDYRDRYGLVATSGADRRIVGHATYMKTDEDRAEVAFAVSDRLQGKGLGTILLAHLAEAATENGVPAFYAEILPANHKMIEVFRQSGFSVNLRAEPGLIVAEFPASLSPEAVERFEMREQTAAVAAMETFFSPRSIAVLGASRRRGSIGGEVFHNLISTGFHGPVYPVNPHAEFVLSVAAYKSVLDCPGPVDLGVVVVPAESVLEVARDCATKGVRALVVISAGFGETGEEGMQRQRDLLAICRESGMRMIGPNCMGIMNTDPDVWLNASFAPDFPPVGHVGFMSQSGALGLAVIDYARELGLGLSMFASAGNKADISGNDLIQYWEADGDTELILLYLESFGNPRKFARIARRVAKHKPILAVKSGRSSAGARATSSHTGALLATSDVTVDALFRQAGVIRTDTLEALFDTASLLANQPPPQGRRVGILTNAGGPGILCADACEANGLAVIELSDGTKAKLAEFLPTEAAFANPVDMIASATGDDYRRAIEVLAVSGEVDSIIVIFIPPLVTRPEDVARAIRDAARAMPANLPLLSVFMQSRGVPSELREGDVGIPSYAFPEDAARALARVVDYGIWRTQPDGRIPEFTGLRRDEAASILANALSEGGRWLRPDEVAQLFSCYGLPLAEWRLVESPEAAGAAAAELDGPVALKAVSPTLVHKTEVGGVRLGLEGRDEVARAATEMVGTVRAAGHESVTILVQRMVPRGVEIIVGMVHDQSFGPVVACGAGGTAVELLKDVQVRIAPLTDRDTSDMVRGLATFPLLDGYRGAPKADVAALESTLLRVSTLVEAHPAIAEMDCNPVMVLEHDAVIVDARVRVEPVAPPQPMSARRKI